MVTIMVKGKKESVLIIDVDQAILDGLSKRFKMQDMLRACNEMPDFIVSEVLLPSLNGFRLSRLLKFDERFKEINLILMTNNDPEFSNDLFKACKADSIIKKPFRFSHLLEKIHTKNLVK